MNIDVFKNKVYTNIKNSDNFKHLKFHLDGSRILNAAAALKVEPKTLVAQFDTINVCLSKALGAPCGSIILMNDEDFNRAREIRKNIGGGMRQAGFLAAPALVALEDWRERFEADHVNAKLFSTELSKIKGLKVPTPDTNIVNIYLDENFISNEKMVDIIAYLKINFKVLLLNFDGNRYIRAVIHHQISRDQVLYAVESIEKTINFFLNKI